MSNFLFMKIKTVIDIDIRNLSQLDNVMDFAKSNGFYIRFNNIHRNSKNAFLTYTVSDNSKVDYCDSFMEPIIYDREGNPIIDSLRRDLLKIKELLERIYSYSFVECVELLFSVAEVDEYEYKKCTTCIEKMNYDLLNEYLATTVFPTIRMIVKR